MHKKGTTEEKEKTAAEKAGKEKTAEHKITAEKKKNTTDEKKEATPTISSPTKTE